MRVVDFDGATGHFGAPKDWNEAKDGPCGRLPVCQHGGWFISVWSPSPEERRRLALGENLTLSIRGVQPVVSLGVQAIIGPELDLADGSRHLPGPGLAMDTLEDVVFEPRYADDLAKGRMDDIARSLSGRLRQVDRRAKAANLAVQRLEAENRLLRVRNAELEAERNAARAADAIVHSLKNESAISRS